MGRLIFVWNYWKVRTLQCWKDAVNQLDEMQQRVCFLSCLKKENYWILNEMNTRGGINVLIFITTLKKGGVLSTIV